MRKYLFDHVTIQIQKMADKMRRAVTSVTDMVFPPPKSFRDAQQHKLINRGMYRTSIGIHVINEDGTRKVQSIFKVELSCTFYIYFDSCLLLTSFNLSSKALMHPQLQLQ